MKAIIMAGGSGTRLRPLTCAEPKPMAKIMNKPVMEHIITLLKKHGITDIGVTLQYMPESIRGYFGDGSGFGVSLTYFVEDSPLGTAGSVAAAGGFLDDDFVVISGDSLCDTDLTAAIAFHKNKRAEATIVLYPMEVPLEYGVVVTDSDSRIERFVEKPVWSQVFSDTINTGIYVLKPTVLEGFRDGNYDFSKDVFPKMLAGGRALYGWVADGYWCDVGDINVYRHCHFDIFDKKLNFRMEAREPYKDVYIGDGALIEDGAEVQAPALIGRGSRIKSGAVIEPYSVIGENVTVCPGASVKRSIIWSGAFIGENAQIRGAVLCDRCVVRSGASVFEQSVIGEGSIVGEGATIKPGIKVWPYKNVGRGEFVSSNMVWNSGGGHELFGEKGISGEINIDISTELIVRLGAAYASMKKGGKIGVSSDGSPGAVMMKNAICAGLMSAGAEVFDFGDQAIPITRSGVKFYGLAGGIHTAVGAEYKRGGYIEVINEFGADISRDEERKLKSLIDRDDFIKSGVEEILPISDLYEYKLYYLREIINSVSERDMGFNVLASAESSWGQRLLSGAAADLKCKMTIMKKSVACGDGKELELFAKNVAGGGYDFGAVINDSCEKLLLADDKGRIISEDMYKAIAALIVMKRYRGASIIAGVSAPSVIEELAEKYGASVRRTKDSPIELMGELSGPDMLPELREQFVMHFDAVGAVIRIMDFLKASKQRLSDLADEIPEFHIVKREVACSFGDKGRVIKRLIESGESDKIKTIDGVQIREDGGYVLIIPDMTKPVCRMIIESAREEYADELAESYKSKIKEILKET